MSKLVIIDGNSLLYRMFFAPGPYLSTSTGVPTGAVFGFTTILLNILEQEKPDSIYVAWDPPGRTFRHEQYGDYKGHRPRAGEDLRAQVPLARRVVEALGIPTLEVPGYEADDAIGTLASLGARQGFDVEIVTGDTDQLQLVGGPVAVRMTRRGVSETTLYDEAAVRERYGIAPQRIPDWKALVGDPSDNIPGVPGVGDKTATRLLQEFGSLEGLLEGLDRVPPGRLRESLEAADGQVRLWRELATIHCDVPFEGPLQPYAPAAENWQRVRALLEELEFRSLLKRLPAAAAPEAHPPVSARVLQSRGELEEALAAVRRAGILALRTHADGPQPMRAALRGLAFAAGSHEGFYLRLSPPAPCQAGPGAGLFAQADEAGGLAAPVEVLAQLLRDEGIGRIAHGGKADLILLARCGAEPGPLAFDTMIAAYLLAPDRSSYPLDQVCQEVLHLRPEAEAGPPEARLAREAACLATLTTQLSARLAAAGLSSVFQKVEMPLVPILAEMEREGVPVDRHALERLAEDLGARIETLAERIYELAGERFTIGSTQQLQRILFEKLKLPAGRRIRTGYSTRADILEALAPEHEIAARILEYRELAKLKTTYADSLPRLINPDTGRLHTSFNQTVASTGRLSSSEPNLQNIPVRTEVGREIRRAFVAPPGQVLLSCDYSQIELRVFAHITRDPEMVRAFEADEDIHAATASRLFGVDLEAVTPEMRRRAKTVNFAVIYGQSEHGLATTLGISHGEAREFIERYFARFPSVREYTRSTLEQARRQGWVQTLLGRRRYLPEINSGNQNVRQAAERAAVNMPIQGAAADIMKLAMIDVHRLLKRRGAPCEMLLQVHDELLFAVDPAALEELRPQIVAAMEGAYPLSVPLRVAARSGPNWADVR